MILRDLPENVCVTSITVVAGKLDQGSARSLSEAGPPKANRSYWRRQMVSRKFSKKFALAWLALAAIAMPALAGDLTDQQIVERLKAPKLTRSLSGTTAEA